MDTDVPRMPSVTNLHKILDSIQKAAMPDAFGMDFLKDMGYTSSNDRSVTKVLKYLGMLDASGKPQTSYSEFMDHTKSKKVLATCIMNAYDDLFKSNKNAHSKTTTDLKGWFKTKTGVGDAVAEKMATTFKSLASYADFSDTPSLPEKPKEQKNDIPTEDQPPKPPEFSEKNLLGLTYRIEIHLPDTTNVDTFRSIFKAIREELIS